MLLATKMSRLDRLRSPDSLPIIHHAYCPDPPLVNLLPPLDLFLRSAIRSNYQVVPGETALAFFTAKNPTKKHITGVATYNVFPLKAGKRQAASGTSWTPPL